MFEWISDTHTSEANLITEEVKALDALLGVTDILKLGKAETKMALALKGISYHGRSGMNDLPLTGTSAVVNDGLALLDLTKARGVLGQEIVVSGGVKSANVDILVPLNAIVKALLESLALLRGSEDGGDSRGNRRFLLDKST